MAEAARHGCVDGAGGIRARNSAELPAGRSAIEITLAGHVQGVGFRPFVYRLAREHGITGNVQNRLGEVRIVACGTQDAIGAFRRDLLGRAPPLSRPRIEKIRPVDAPACREFDIVASAADADARIFVPPDFFMCDDCRRELDDPGDRRFRYPFINCTQCGPRYTLIEKLPYDRPNTSMAGFPLCPACRKEYSDPGNRRFHAEPVACPDCGPRLELVQAGRRLPGSSDAALAGALQALRGGSILAVKGIGGYHLMCDARNDTAVATLRERKRRPAKPLAVMFPLAGRDGLESLRHYVDPDPVEVAALTSPGRPIVLVTRRPASDLAAGIAPGLAELGAFLPYSPLHQLLLGEFGAPLVATSANISGEPVLTDNAEVERRLQSVADAFLHHDRRIVRPADDPVYRRIAGSARPLRVGRGCAPRELQLPWRLRQPLLAVGGHMKGTLALAWDDRVVVSPHIGEMDSPRSLAVFEQVARDLQALYGVTATRIGCDEHPGYTTARWARSLDLPVEPVWHHRAHASALVAETGLPGSWLVFAWDGVGLGEDGTLWGGEALLGTAGNWKRVASLRPFRLPGGDRAGREPWRSAAAVLWECGEDWKDCPDSDGIARQAWRQNINCPQTSAAGRLFDAAAALVTGRSHVSFEAEGPMRLEALCRERRDPIYCSLAQDSDGTWRSDWQPMLAMLRDDALGARERAEIFHASMALVLLQQARRIRDEFRVDYIGLSGGVFQNRFLTEQAVDLLRRAGFRVLLADELPCNDAALSYGQAAEIAARDAEERLDG